MSWRIWMHPQSSPGATSGVLSRSYRAWCGIGRPTLVLFFCTGVWALALLLGLYAWLGVADASTGLLAGQALLALGLLLFLALGLAFLVRSSEHEQADAATASPRHSWWGGVGKALLAILLWALLAWLILSAFHWLLHRAWAAQSEITYRLHAPIALAWFTLPLKLARWVLELVVLPAFAIGLFARAWRGKHTAQLPFKSWFFWIVALLLALVGDELPWLLALWRPHVFPDWHEVLTVMARLLIAASIFVWFLPLQVAWYAQQRPVLTQDGV